ncbi:CpaF family protein [Roseomonas sp. KE2513]|uniref:CpaF family protein n=1 Tax=Roseomonas sp. KE2513 TaxID=2479202 RepID=UPI0018E0312C|nr:CpaF family protein [Roseomonas sp. KE2513]MBI0539270.1 CpaF family protein [Roseomonas sp. KE2513]
MKPFGRRAEFASPSASAESVPADAVDALPERPATRAAPLSRLRTQVLDRVDPVVAAELPASVLRSQLEALVHELAGRDRLELSAREQARLAEELTHDMVGYGPLEPLLQDDSISDIMVNGPDRVFIEVRGKMRLSDVRFRDAAQVANIAQKMAAAVGRRVDESSPLLDCRLADGSRVNVVFPPLALDGPCLSIRKFSKKKIDFAAMVANGSMIPSVARVLEIAARCRLNIVVSGGTGSGKTTMMNALSRLIDHEERIVTIEDAAELQLQQPHVVRLETRPPNLEGKGEINQRDLMKNALRMRPDRIIVGEVRGAEAFDMLQAMNTGHDGSICTIHANTARDAVTRIENMVQMGSMSLPQRAIRTQIASAVDLIVQVERMRDGVRRVAQIADVCGLEGDVITMNDVFTYEFEGEDANGGLLGRYVSSRTRPGFSEKLRYFGLERAWMDAVQELPA